MFCSILFCYLAHAYNANDENNVFTVSVLLHRRGVKGFEFFLRIVTILYLVTGAKATEEKKVCSKILYNIQMNFEFTGKKT